MSVADFYRAPDLERARSHEDAGQTVELGCPVVHPASLPAVAEALGIGEEDARRIVNMELAYADGEVFDESAWVDQRGEADFTEHTGPTLVERVAPALVFRAIPVEPDRLARLSGRMSPPIDDVDALLIELPHKRHRLEYLIELGAPSILIRSARHRIQTIFEIVVDLYKERRPSRWRPMDELMTGTVPEPTATTPWPSQANTWSGDPTWPRAGLAWGGGFGVSFEFLSIVWDEDGVVIDQFPTSGLRYAAHHDRWIMFVSGGGYTGRSGYFTPVPVVRDVVAGAWLEGEVPTGLPRYIAGTIWDVRWAVVRDLTTGLGYRISPFWEGDQCGGTTATPDGRYAYDSGDFVVESESGRRVLDVRHLDREVWSFVQLDSGAWRFVATTWDDDQPCGVELVDEHGGVVCALPHNGAALIAGERVVAAGQDRLDVLDATTGDALFGYDITAFGAALALPEADDEDAAREALAFCGCAEEIAAYEPNALSEAMQHATLRSADVTGLAAIIRAAKSIPKLSALEQVPRT